MEDQPKGELFSRIYIPKGDPLPDSPRFRVRLAAKASEISYSHSKFQLGFSKLVEGELGVKVPFVKWGTSGNWSIGLFFEKAEIRDVLDGISLLARFVVDKGADYYVQQWVDFVARVFVEENLHYRIDEKGGVHYLVDREFERNKNTVLSCLGGKFSAVEESLDAAFSRLGRKPFDTKAAVRDIFEAAESLTKQITNSGHDLTERFVNAKIAPMVKRVYGGIDRSANSAGDILLIGFSQWVNAAHNYRHGQKDTKVIAPPFELAVLLLSQGASYIRWLVEIHNLHENGGK